VSTATTGAASTPTMVKLALDTSKNTLPTQEARTRACVVLGAGAGTMTEAEPLLAVLAASSNGQLAPPSTDRSRRTLAQETGAASVLATFQVTVCGSARSQVVAVLGLVTTNGPALVVTANVMFALSVRPNCGVP